MRGMFCCSGEKGWWHDKPHDAKVGDLGHLRRIGAADCPIVLQMAGINAVDDTVYDRRHDKPESHRGGLKTGEGWEEPPHRGRRTSSRTG